MQVLFAGGLFPYLKLSLRLTVALIAVYTVFEEVKYFILTPLRFLHLIGHLFLLIGFSSLLAAADVMFGALHARLHTHQMRSIAGRGVEVREVEH